jgi:hypothetical protein
MDDRPATDLIEIEITPAMIDAGAEVIMEWRDIADAYFMAKKVYQAMELARSAHAAASHPVR